MPQSSSLLVSVLRDLAFAPNLRAVEWDLVIRQARRANLLAQLGIRLDEAGVGKDLPLKIRRHLESARIVAEAHRRAIAWEVERIHTALVDVGVPVVLLKGAAYVMGGLAVGAGRIFQDVDIMVPKPALPEVEAALRAHGWVTTHLDDYDQRYYRQWMHELPPMIHVRRRSVLDVHHTILPETARLRPDPAKLLRDARPVAGYSDLYMLSPADMVLHSATHLFHDGELDHGLRDLFDLDGLIRQFAEEEAFWSGLTARAAELDLTRPLYYGLRYARRIVGTPMPQGAEDGLRFAGPTGTSFLMDGVFERALQPDHKSCSTALTGAARWLLYVRSHYLRMPLYLLIPHLLRKSTRRDGARAG